MRQNRRDAPTYELDRRPEPLGCMKAVCLSSGSLWASIGASDISASRPQPHRSRRSGIHSLGHQSYLSPLLRDAGSGTRESRAKRDTVGLRHRSAPQPGEAHSSDEARMGYLILTGGREPPHVGPSGAQWLVTTTPYRPLSGCHQAKASLTASGIHFAKQSACGLRV